MFVNKSVKSLKNVKSVKSVKNVNKTKHHKRNKNKKRSIKNLSIKYMRGGSGNTSGASGASGASDSASASAIISIPIPTLLELIQSKDYTMCEIHYDDVKIICLLGNDYVSLGYDNTNTTKNACIVIEYYKDKQDEKIYYNATLDSFFHNMSKQNCLYSSKDNSKVNSKDDKSLINNRVFHSTKGNYKYNKIINILLLELVDAINIHLGVKYCKVIDAATVKCKDNTKLSMKLKHITKGYGFYNDFGYIYTQDINDDEQVTQYKLLDLQFANYILTIIDKLSLQYKQEHNLFEEACKSTKNNNKKLNPVTIDLKFMDFTTAIIQFIINNKSQYNKDAAIYAFLFNNFIKYYTYNDDNTTVSKSELLTTPNPVVQDPPQTTPYHFAMVKYTRPTITITSLQLQEEQPPNPYKLLYLIKITKGTKKE